MHCNVYLYAWVFTWYPQHMDSNQSPPGGKAQERDANGHSNSSTHVKVRRDLTIPVAYSKQIETPFRDQWVLKYQYLHQKLRNLMESTYTLVMGCKCNLNTPRPYIYTYLGHFLPIFYETGVDTHGNKGVKFNFIILRTLTIHVAIPLILEKNYNIKH